MPSLQIRDMPETLYKKLAEKAKREHRSLAQQAVVELAGVLDIQLDYQEKRTRVFALLAELNQDIETSCLSDPAVLIREDRDQG